MIHWTDEDDALILKLLKEGVPVLEIGRRMNRTRSAIYHRTWRLGEATPKRPNVVTNDPAIVAKVLEMYEQGYPYKEIMKALGISKDNVCHIVRLHVPVKRSKRKIKGMRIYPDELVEKVRVRFLERDMTARKIAEELEVRYHVVRDICCAHGFRRSRKWRPEEIRTVVEMLDRGDGLAETAAAIKRSPSAVWQRLNELRLHLNYPRIHSEMIKAVHGGDLKGVFKVRVKGCIHTDTRKGQRSDLTVEHLMNLWERQGGKCYYTGRPMNLITHHDEAVSVDRVDSTLPHLIGNVVLCGRRVNHVKSNMTVQDFTDLCRMVADYSSSRPSVLVAV